MVFSLWQGFREQTGRLMFALGLYDHNINSGIVNKTGQLFCIFFASVRYLKKTNC